MRRLKKKVKKITREKAKTMLTFMAKRSERANSVIRRTRSRRLQRKFSQLCAANPVNQKSIVFSSFMGRAYADSPQAMYKRMVQDPFFDEWDFIWALRKKPFNKFNSTKTTATKLVQELGVNEDIFGESKYDEYSRAKIVRYSSKKYYRALAESKYWITNSRAQDGLFPSDNHKYIQTWHGTPLKRIGADIETGANAMYSQDQVSTLYKLESGRWDYLVSPSKFYTEKIKSAFGVANNSITKIVEKGYPRNDYLSNFNKEDVQIIRKKFKIPGSKKVLLYAPTWRDDQHDSRKGYTYDLGIDFDLLKERLGDEWVVLFRAHYFVANSFDFSKYKGFVYNASTHGDINELYVLADALITDYSSVFFDYSILQRPIIFFMYDKDQYKNLLRGFYLELEELPGSIVETNEELAGLIEDIDYYKTQHTVKLREFKQKFCSMDDGNASQRAIDFIFKETR